LGAGWGGWWGERVFVVQVFGWVLLPPT
jgi:hypothetical protein